MLTLWLGHQFNLVTWEMVAEAMGKMKCGKAPGPSGVVVEMLKASAEVCNPFLCSLMISIIAEKKSLLIGMRAT